MAPGEYFGWEQHFLRYPPGDYLLQKILAEFWALFASFATGEQQSYLTVAPWLEDPDAQVNREKELKEQAEIQKTQRVAAAFQSLLKKKDQDAG